MSTEKEEKQVGLDAAEAHVAQTYTTRNPFEILSDAREEPPEIWGGLTLQRGQLMEVIGSSGLGKSRLMVNLAINQILGRDFAGMPTYSTPLTWLFFGNENSFFRYRHDLRKMMSILKTEEKEKVFSHLWLPTVENPGDSYLSFADDDNIEKFKATIRQRKPDVLVLDPWGAIIDGDELSDQDVRHTLSTLLSAISECSQDKPLPVIILNHSRMGANETVKASGPEAANFGKNSKAIFTVMRNVWNLRRGSEEGAEMPIVEFIHAKCSDRKLYPKSAVELDPNTLHYNHLPNFNHELWQSELEKEAYSKTQLSPVEKAKARQGKLADWTAEVKDYINNLPMAISNDDFFEHCSKMRIDSDSFKRIKKKLIEAGDLGHIMHRSSSIHYYGKPELIDNYLSRMGESYVRMP